MSTRRDNVKAQQASHARRMREKAAEKKAEASQVKQESKPDPYARMLDRLRGDIAARKAKDEK